MGRYDIQFNFVNVHNIMNEENSNEVEHGNVTENETSSVKEEQNLDERIHELETELEEKQSELTQTMDLLKQAQAQNVKLIQMIENDNNQVEECTEMRPVRGDSLITRLRQSRRVLQEIQVRCDRVIGRKY